MKHLIAYSRTRFQANQQNNEHNFEILIPVFTTGADDQEFKKLILPLKMVFTFATETLNISTAVHKTSGWRFQSFEFHELRSKSMCKVVYINKNDAWIWSGKQNFCFKSFKQSSLLLYVPPKIVFFTYIDLRSAL